MSLLLHNNLPVSCFRKVIKQYGSSHDKVRSDGSRRKEENIQDVKGRKVSRLDLICNVIVDDRLSFYMNESSTFLLTCII